MKKAAATWVGENAVQPQPDQRSAEQRREAITQCPCGGRGVASLMCSGVSLVLVAVVGLAVLVRRGWKPAVFHTVPLGVLYAIWFLTTDPGGIDNPYGRSADARELLRFIWSGVRGDFRAIGASRPFAILIAGILVVGLTLSLRRFGGTGLRQRFAPVALLAGAALFLIGTGYTRWFVTPVADTQSRYLYTLAAFTLPAIAVGVDEIARRWRPAAPLLLVLFLVGIVANVNDFGSHAPFTAAYHNRQKELVLTMAHSDVGPTRARLCASESVVQYRMAARRGRGRRRAAPGEGFSGDRAATAALARVDTVDESGRSNQLPHTLGWGHARAGEGGPAHVRLRRRSLRLEQTISCRTWSS